MSFVLKLSGNTSVLKANYFPPIILDGEFEVAVISMETWNSIANITSKNNKFYYDQNREITIPEGSYEISDIEKYLARQLKAEHVKHPIADFGEEAIILEGNHSTFKTEILCRYAIDFTKPDNIGSILGFDKVVLEPFKRHESTGLIKILTVEALPVECNLITNSFSNSKRSRDLYSCSLDEPPGYKIHDTPKNLLYLPVTVREITEIELRLVDQDGNLVDLRGELTTIRLHLRKT